MKSTSRRSTTTRLGSVAIASHSTASRAGAVAMSISPAAVRTTVSPPDRTSHPKRGAVVGPLRFQRSRLMVDEETLDDTLTRVAYLACMSPIGAEPPDSPCNASRVLPPRRFLVRFGRLADEAQYASNDGPCLTAFRTGQTVRLDWIAEESRRWPAFAARAAEHGIVSNLSLPLTVRERTVGALNLFACTLAPFDDASVELGQTFARQAAVARSNAGTYELTQNLGVALENQEGVLRFYECEILPAFREQRALSNVS
jgi:GAF domain-containing protein